MTVRDFLATLPRDPDTALAEIEGALEFDGVGARGGTWGRLG